MLLDISVHQNQTQICSAGGFFCTINSDTLISSVIAMALTVVIGLWIARTLQHGRPGKLQMILEALYGYVRGLTAETVSPSAVFIIPVAMTVTFFILVANWLDFLPIVKPIVPPASDWNLTLAMALVVFFWVQGYAFKVKGLVRYLAYAPAATFFIPLGIGVFVGALSGALLPGLVVGYVVAEILSIIGVFLRPHKINGLAIDILFTFPLPLTALEDLIKPVTLSLRLFGNILAGTIMVQLLASFVAWPVLLPVWKAFDVFLIGSIQALIFMLLTIIYFGMAREGLEEEHGGQAAAHN